MRSIIPSVVIPCLVVSLAAPPCVLEFVLDGQRYEVDVSGYDRSAEETEGMHSLHEQLPRKCDVGNVQAAHHAF